MKNDNSPTRGMRDFLPETVAKRAQVLKTITDTYETYGFQQIETPVVESIERLTAGSSDSENQKLIFQILKRGVDSDLAPGTSIGDLVDSGLRFDLTVPLARYFAQNQAKLRLPFRALQVGPVWRAERPQKGRFRQFVQCDIDIIGEPSVLAEIELITATSKAIQRLALNGEPDGVVTVHLSDRRLLSGIADSAAIAQNLRGRFFVALDKLDKIGWEGVGDELEKIGVSREQSKQVTEVIDQLSGVSGAELMSASEKLLPGIDQKVVDDLRITIDAVPAFCRVELDPSLVRGMGYYTGQIFEIRDPTLGLSVAGGGRYDGLIGSYSGSDVPAIGFSIGFERILEILGEQPSRNGVALLFDEDVDIVSATQAGSLLRDSLGNVSVLRRSGSMKGQLQRLSEWGFESYAYLKSGSDPSGALEVNKLS